MNEQGTGNGTPAVQKMEGLVEYQNDAIVSRVLLQAPYGSVTLFAIWGGQKISEHTAPFDALVMVLEGETEITIGGRAHRLVAGETVLMPGGVPHALAATRNMKMLLTMIKK